MASARDRVYYDGYARGVNAFIESHRNKDGGYATKPGEPSSMSGAYYCVIVSKWLDDMEAAKKK